MNRLRDSLLCVVLLVAPLLFLRANMRDAAHVGPLDRALLLLSAPIQKATTRGAEKVGAVWREYVFLVDLRRQNDQLLRENRQLQSDVKRTQVAADRAAHLEHLLELQKDVPAETVAARVIAHDTSPYVHRIRVALDRGPHEVAPGMAVIAPEGVVGRIDRVYGDYSDILLPIDPKSAIDVRILPSGARGIARGLGTDRFACRLEYVLHEEVVHLGDRVVTSGQSSFPRDIEVGRITRVTRPKGGLYQQIEIQPSVDLARLEHVLVVLAPPPSPDLEATTRRREAARGLEVHR